MEELSDHFEDLKEENMEADAISRLGEPEQLADNAVAAYRRRSFLGRHPMAAFLFFGVSPILSLILSLIGAVALVEGIFELFDKLLPGDEFCSFLRHLGPFGRTISPYLLSMMFPMIPCVLGSLLHYKLARRFALSGRWVLLSCAVLAVLAGLSIWTVKVSDIPGQSVIQFGLGIPRDIVGLPSVIAGVFTNPLRLVQFFIPLVIGWWFVRRMRDRGQLQLAS